MDNSSKWGRPHILNFYNKNRNSWKDLYKGEKIIIKKILKKNFSILDIGCAQGGLSVALKEKIKNFSYTGLDYNSLMIKKAKKKFPSHDFIKIKNSNLSKLFDVKFDIVFVLGILHLNRNWKKILSEAYKLTRKYIVFDLREIQNIKIKKKIHQNLNLGKKSKKKNLINYYIHKKRNIDSFLNLKFKHDKIESVTYEKNPSKFTNYKKPILFSTYLISKKKK